MENIKIVITGCGDAFGNGGRLNTCFYIETEEIRFLIDCGASALPGLKKRQIDIGAIDLIFVTHFHGDHFGGIPFLLMDAAANGRTSDLTIISPVGGKDKISALLELLYPGNSALKKLNINFMEYPEVKELKLEKLTVLALPVIHSEPSLPHGLRITLNNKVISYSGDTSWTDNLIPLSNDADLFICECNFYHTHIKGHMTYKDLESRRKDLTCKRLLLTHFDTEMLDNLEHLKFECAADGMEVYI